MKQSCEQG